MPIPANLTLRGTPDHEPSGRDSAPKCQRRRREDVPKTPRNSSLPSWVPSERAMLFSPPPRAPPSTPARSSIIPPPCSDGPCGDLEDGDPPCGDGARGVPEDEDPWGEEGTGASGEGQETRRLLGLPRISSSMRLASASMAA